MFRGAASSVRAVTRPSRLTPSSPASPVSVPLRRAAPPFAFASSSRLRPYSTEPAPKDKAAGAEAKNGEAKSADAEKIASLEAKVKELEGTESAKWQKDILYQRAEAQTLNRRVVEERNKASEFAITKFARSLLGTADILDTAMTHVPKPIEPNTPLSTFFSGVDMTHKNLLKTFGEAGVVKMEVGRGTAFDPNLHEATFQIPKEVAGEPPKGKSEWGSGEVVEVGKEGWMIGTRVLRPAQVGVTQIE